MIKVTPSALKKDIEHLLIPPEELEQHRKEWSPKKPPLISVLIPTYNRCEELINGTIPSVLNQTYKNIEVIVIGDYCTDNTVKEIKKIKDERLIFANLPQPTLYPKDIVFKWFSAGIGPMIVARQLARGDWIIKLDDHDKLEPNALESLLNFAEEHSLEHVGGSVLVREGQVTVARVPWTGGAIFRNYLGDYIYPTGEEFFNWLICPFDKLQTQILLYSGIKWGAIKQVVASKGKKSTAIYAKSPLLKKYETNYELWNYIVKQEIERKNDILDILRESGMDWDALRPVFESALIMQRNKESQKKKKDGSKSKSLTPKKKTAPQTSTKIKTPISQIPSKMKKLTPQIPNKVKKNVKKYSSLPRPTLKTSNIKLDKDLLNKLVKLAHEQQTKKNK